MRNQSNANTLTSFQIMKTANPLKPKRAAGRTSPSSSRMWLCSLMAVFLGACIAQARASSPVFLYCPAYSENIRTVYLEIGENKYRSVTLSIANIIELPSPPIEQGRVTFYGPAGEDGQHTIAAVAEIGAKGNPLIVLHPSGPDAETAYEAVIVDADIRAFPLASFQLLNLSPYPVRFNKYEALITEMQSGESHNLKPDNAPGTPFPIRVKYETGDNWTLISSSSWVARNDRRTLVCILRDPHSERMNIRSVPLREISGR